jgi:opacity protein-like surface antigen
MKNLLLALVATLTLLSPTQASVLETQTRPSAQDADLYGTFHDGQTDFVFVKLPTGWVFVAQDPTASHHEVFLDAGTGFVFVKLSDGWKFVRSVA